MMEGKTKFHKGYFWNPQNPDKVYGGTVTIIDNEKIKLELIGGWLSEFAMFMGELQFIHGTIAVDHGTLKCTLINCDEYGSQRGTKETGIIHVTNYNCQFLITGVHLHNLESAEFRKIKIGFPCLQDWYKANVFKEERITKGKAIFTIDNTRFDPKKYKVRDNLYLKIGDYSQSYDLSRHEKCLSQVTYIELESTENQAILVLLSEAKWFKYFYSFACLHAMPFSEVYLYHPETTEPMRLYCFGEDKYEHKKPYFTYNFLFEFNDIENHFEQVIQNWFLAKSDGELVLEQLLLSVTQGGYFRSRNFLSVVQAIEGYYNRFIGEEGLYNILSKLYCNYNSISIVQKYKVDISAIVDSRHYYTHILPSGKKKKVLRNLELYNAAKWLEPLLVCSVLSLVGIEMTSIDKLVNNYYQNKLPNLNYL